MTTDGSTGRRDGFNRWVASMKNEHQPMETKPAPLKPAVGKLELELDDNATHVHRIPKELISRMREREQPPAPPKEEPGDDEEEERSGLSPLGMVQEDRTAVFRPPPELLARAKRMKAPPKPDAQASVPTKPPPASQAELVQSMPASPKVPAFESMPAAAKGGFSSVPVKTPLAASASARTPMAAMARAAAPLPAVEKAAVSAEFLDFTESLAENAPPASASAPAPDSSAVFAKREPASGVLPVASEPAPSAEDDNDEPTTREYSLPELGISRPARGSETAVPAETPVAAAEAERALSEPFAPKAEAESPFAFEPSSVVPIVPPPVDVAGPALSEPPEAEQPPTTHAPVVRAEANPAVEPGSSSITRVLLFVIAAVAAAAYAWWRTRHV